MLYFKPSIYTKYMFFKQPGEKGDSFNFSTDLHKVGYEWDVSIQNGTGIDIVSDPVTIDHSKYGLISLIKIEADIATDYHTIIKEFWVPVDCIVDTSHSLN